MDPNSKSAILLLEYKKKSDAIISKMLEVLLRAGRKVDNTQYQKILDQVDREIQSS